MKTKGFTLLELLVVLVIIGIVTSLAVLRMGNPLADQITEEAARITRLIELAKEEAILENKEYGLAFSHQGYRFFVLDEETGQWQPLETDRFLRPRQWPETLEAELELEEQPVLLEEKPLEKPQVFIFSSGEMTPFTLHLKQLDDARLDTELSFDHFGLQPRTDEG